MIVTFNLADFPERELARFGVEATHPDELVLKLLVHDSELVCTAVREQAGALRNPPRTPAELLDTIETCGLPRTAARLREMLR